MAATVSASQENSAAAQPGVHPRRTKEGKRRIRSAHDASSSRSAGTGTGAGHGKLTSQSGDPLAPPLRSGGCAHPAQVAQHGSTEHRSQPISSCHAGLIQEHQARRFARRRSMARNASSGRKQ